MPFMYDADPGMAHGSAAQIKCQDNATATAGVQPELVICDDGTWVPAMLQVRIQEGIIYIIQVRTQQGMGVIGPCL